MYALLAELFGWTPAQCAELTPAQIFMILEEHAQRLDGGSIDPRTNRRTIRVDSLEEALSLQRRMAAER